MNIESNYLLFYKLFSPFFPLFGQRTFFSITELVFRGKRDFYLFYYNAIFKDSALFKQTQGIIEIDVIVAEKHVYLNSVEKYLD